MNLHRTVFVPRNMGVLLKFKEMQFIPFTYVTYTRHALYRSVDDLWDYYVTPGARF